MKARSLFLIKRGPQSEHHKATFHPVIICSRLHSARWEAGNTPDGSTVFENRDADSASSWRLCQYNGYGFVFRNMGMHFTLYDGLYTGDVEKEAASLLSGAVWWSYDEMPEWLKSAGVVYADDDFTKKSIWDDSGNCMLSESKVTALRSSRGNLKPHWL